MLPPVDTRLPEQVEQQVTNIYHSLFPDADPAFVGTAFSWVQRCFEGKYRDYLPVDTKYHDLEHTLQGTLCLMRLLDGRQRAGAEPVLTKHIFELGLLAVLFHDTGYLKKANDTDGTGAKYTLIHVNRSAEFAAAFLGERGYSAAEQKSVQNMIRCTGVSTDPRTLPFQSELERIVGYALGTSDLLGQMAAPDYIDKLPILYQEFDEACRFSGRAGSHLCYSDAHELMVRTPGFWEHAVLPRINNQFQNLYTFLNDPYPDGPNPYVQEIEANIQRLRERLQQLQS